MKCKQKKQNQKNSFSNNLKSNKMTEQMYPCLWFDGQARAAADFYCTIFPNSKIINDSGMVVNFELNGQFFMGLNGGR